MLADSCWPRSFPSTDPITAVWTLQSIAMGKLGELLSHPDEIIPMVRTGNPRNFPNPGSKPLDWVGVLC